MPKHPGYSPKTEHIRKLEQMLGDHVIAGVAVPWSDVEFSLREMTTSALRSLVYRIERLAHLAATEKNDA
jgi:hypothetical protein